MSCLCQKIAGKHFELSPICLGQLWMFDNLAPAEVAALTKEAERKKLEKSQVLFMQSDPAEDTILLYITPAYSVFIEIQPSWIQVVSATCLPVKTC